MFPLPVSKWKLRSECVESRYVGRRDRERSQPAHTKLRGGSSMVEPRCGPEPCSPLRRIEHAPPSPSARRRRQQPQATTNGGGGRLLRTSLWGRFPDQQGKYREVRRFRLSQRPSQQRFQSRSAKLQTNSLRTRTGIFLERTGNSRSGTGNRHSLISICIETWEASPESLLLRRPRSRMSARRLRARRNDQAQGPEGIAGSNSSTVIAK